MQKFFQTLLSLFLSFLSMLGIYTPKEEVKLKETAVCQIAAIENIRQLEGGCTDGRYVYQAIIDPTYVGEQYAIAPSKIVKIDTQDWSIVATSDEFDNLNHANDMTYNKADGTLMICNNVPNTTTISVIDIDSLKLVKTIEVSRPLYAIVYTGDVDSNCYYCGISESYDIVKYDKDFNETGTMSVTDNGYTRQSIDTDGEYLYFPYYYKDSDGAKHNYIYKYKLDGTAQGMIELSDTSNELESVFFLSGQMYVIYNFLGTGNGGQICKVENYEFK